MNNLSMHILDIVQNSIAGGASAVEIKVDVQMLKNTFTITIIDNGRGMDEEMLNHVTDPYTTTRTTRKVGLGLPLLKHTAEQANGYLKIHSEINCGTEVYALLQNDHIDRPDLGDIAGTIVLLAAANPAIEIKYIHQINDKHYIFDTREVKEALEGMPINDPKIRNYLKEMINENIEELYVV
ncbi:MAG TPA: ATP-binding protein [Bacteroidales bacterium]|nr:ATP-binding protein [Bacteroidales bacterium]